jgi:anti-sigma factor RsiW
MSECGVTTNRLQEFFDGELAEDQLSSVQDHVESCADCHGQIQEWESARVNLRSLVDESVGEVDTLVALATIRQRVAARDSAPWHRRLSYWWSETMGERRSAFVGIVVAAALGAIVAPGVNLMLRSSGHDHAPVALVERLEVSGDARAVVSHGESRTTTLIWVEPTENARNVEDN